MRLSQLFTKTAKSVSLDTQSINAQLLTRAGFIRQEIAGVYTYLPLGLKVLNKIENIVRSEMDTVASEVLMPTFSPLSSWRKTGRLDSVDVLFKAVGANQLSRTRNDTEYIVNSTHEEVITPIAQHFRSSYRDFPFAVYQIQTKFRNEPRAKSGLLRGREFRMKDLYSFHTDEYDLQKFYDKMKQVYFTVFRKLGLGHDTFLTYAAGGDFTDQYSHEFQTLLPNGEDTIFLDRQNKIAYNREIATPADAKKLKVDFNKLEEVRASEVGNIFPLGTKYAKAFDYTYADKNNQHHYVAMGCFGMGTSRLMGVIAEKFANERGLVWPQQVAPALVHLVSLGDDKRVIKEADKLYQQLVEFGIEVVYDDRKESAGVKLADADLIGLPLRLTLSQRELKNKSVEVTDRATNKTKHVKLVAGLTAIIK